MDLELANRVVLVVGGHGLLGSAIVTQLRKEGATTVAASRHATDGLTLDAQDDESVRAGVELLLARHGRIDGLVVAAAPSARTLDPARNSDPAQVIDAVDAKAMTFLRLANAVLPAMREQQYGRIVGLSGQNAFLTGNITGSVRNAAVIIVAKNLADEVAGTGVTVNVVNPSIASAEPSPDIPLGRSGQSRPEDTARLVTFLMSPLTSSINGESIAVGHRVRGATGL